MSAVLKFAPFGTETDPGFWSSVANVKILEDKLEETTHNLVGMYDIRRGARPESSCRMMVHQSALTSNTVTVMDAIRCEGSIKNFNTLEAFKRSDKAAILHKAGEQIWDAIQDGTIYSIPSLLSKFTIVSFAELKKYKFYSWFAFPALRTDWAEKVDIQRPFNKHESTALVEEVGTYRRKESDERQHGFFLAKKVRKDSKSADPISDSSTQINYEWVIGTLGEYERGFFDTVAPENRYVCFVDPSTYDESPAWPIRNLLALVRYRWKWLEVQILCYRDIHARREEAKSIVIKLKTPFEDRELALTNSPEMPKVVGWMRTDGKLKATVTDLGAHMDPRNLADQAVDLNNKLMKWRIAPDLDLQTIKETKCLLLGAGTLGSYVARNLLGWGVRKITFVDNGKVSYSNPVRQPLFGFKDCLEGGVPKAERAAQALREIYPGVESEGYSMSVPMLGHPMMNEAATKEDFDLLKKLIDEHDVIFLLMDTRESRWLPTVMGKASGKIILNAALGFDTYLVMRHGVTPINGGEAALGCYFCNDVVAPENSTKDATLDQQCTVTRPGAAPLAAAYLSELMVSILQHPLKAHAPAPQMSTQQSSSIGNISYERDPQEHPLGIIPHQIRGFMATFQNMLIKGQSYDCCSACSPKIVDAYNEHGFEFVKKALQQHDYVEELSGLAAVKKIAMEADIIDFDDSEEEEGDGVPVMI